MTKKSKMRKLVLLFVLLVAFIALYFVVEKVNKEKEEAKENESEARITIHSMDVSSIKSFSYSYQGTEYVYQKENEVWTCINDTSIELDQNLVDNLMNNFKEVYASRIVEESATDLSQYGLDNPANKIKVTDTMDQTITYDIGNENKTVNGYYMKTEDNNTIYLIHDFPTYFNKNLEDLKKVETKSSDSEATTQE